MSPRRRLLRVTSFDAAVTDFRVSPADQGGRLITATVQFLNRTDHPLILGYVSGSGVSMDDQGNRYVVYGDGAVRGIGSPREWLRSQVHPPSGESSDAPSSCSSVHDARPASRHAIHLDLAVRLIEPLGGTTSPGGSTRCTSRSPARVAVGRRGSGCRTDGGTGPRRVEHGAGWARVPSPTSAPADSAATGGPFVAEVTSMTAGIEGGRHHVLAQRRALQRTCGPPIILAYSPAPAARRTISAIAMDGDGRAPTQQRPGDGKVERTGADAQFVSLRRESREARFFVIRYEAARKELGTAFNQDLSVLLLEPLPSGQIRVGREFA